MPNTMKARDTVFSLVACSSCPGAVYMNSLPQPLEEESSGHSIYPPNKCWILPVISIIEDRSRQFFPTNFFPVRIFKISLKFNYLHTILLPESWIMMNIWSQSEQDWHFLVSDLLMAIWFYQTVVMFMVLLENSLMRGTHRAFNWACCSKNGQLLSQPRELRNLFSQLLKTSEDGDCRISLGKLLPCLIGHMGKSFSFYSVENRLYWISLLSSPFQVFWTLYLQTFSLGIPSTQFLKEPKPGFLHLGSVPSYSPSSLPLGSSNPPAHGH